MKITTARAVSLVPADQAFAVSYLRVSTKEQAEKGGTEEGYSIPAQREANARKAAELGAVIVEEFVDAGESARKADRPDLKRMLEFVKNNPVSYCIVHKVDRLARNRLDDSEIHFMLRAAGVMLVSVSENIDETPSGMLVHGIMSSIAEFYSYNLAQEVVKGMTQKAITGGTPGRAPVGYRNVVQTNSDYRTVRTVIVDTERAPLVQWAFTAYATGNWTLTQLQKELASRGLTTVPTASRAAMPMVKASVHRMLTNPYYKGDVVYRGTRYSGNHDPIVPPEVWYQVQSVLRTHLAAAERTQRHHHYLKGTLYCGQCGSRLVISNAKSKTGTIYPYFVCSGRSSGRKNCTRRATLITDVEKLVEDYYRRIQLTAGQIEEIRKNLDAEFDHRIKQGKKELQQLLATRDKLRGEQDKLLEAHFAGALPLDVLSRHQNRIAAELDQLQRRIEAEEIDYREAKDYLADTVDLFTNCYSIYANADDQDRRLCNQAFFSKIIVDDKEEITAMMQAPFSVMHPNTATTTTARDTKDKTALARPRTNSLVRGSHKNRQVRPKGFEPLAF